MTTLTLLVALTCAVPFEAAAGGDGRALLERAVERLDALARERALFFEVASEYQGFLGGHSPGGIGRPSDTVSACVAPDGTLVARLGPVTAVRVGDAVAARDDRLGWFRLEGVPPARHRSEFSVLQHLFTPREILAYAVEDGVVPDVLDAPGGRTLRWRFGDRTSRRLAGVLARPRRGQPRRPGTFRATCEAQLDADGAPSTLDVELLVRQPAGQHDLTIRRHVTYRLWFQDEASPGWDVPLEALVALGLERPASRGGSGPSSEGDSK